MSSECTYYSQLLVHFIWSSISDDWWFVELCSKYPKELCDIKFTKSTTITKNLSINDHEFYWSINSKSKSWKALEDNNKDWITTIFDCCTSILVWIKPICFSNGNINDANKHTNMITTLPMPIWNPMMCSMMKGTCPSIPTTQIPVIIHVSINT